MYHQDLPRLYKYAHFWQVFCFYPFEMAKIKYQKIPKTFTEQVELLKKRGLTVPNENKAAKVLESISYNRLSAYWYPLLQEPKDDEIFKENSSFETAFHFYQFDSELRSLTFHAIEQIEVALRTQVIYHMSHKYGTGFWYERPEAFSSYPYYVSLLSKICKGVAETKQDFIKKYDRKYEQYLPPAWKSFEIITFRTLYSIYKNLKEAQDKISISKKFGVHHSVFISWMDSLVYIRNICAHHTRLWNITLTISPVWPKSLKFDWVHRWENEPKNVKTNDKKLKVYATACLIAYLLDRINPYHRFKDNLKTLLMKFPDVDIAHMGFPENWEDEPLWKTGNKQLNP